MSNLMSAFFIVPLVDTMAPTQINLVLSRLRNLRSAFLKFRVTAISCPLQMMGRVSDEEPHT